MKNFKKISIFGVCGIVGVTTASLVAAQKDRFRVVALTTRSNYRLLAKQTLMLKPEIIAIAEPLLYKPLCDLLAGTSVKILCGSEGITEAESQKVDTSIVAVEGFAALNTTLNAVKNSSTVGIVNKESIVCAWNIIAATATQHKTSVIPVDSEHNAIFRINGSLQTKNHKIKNLIITSSGGPCRLMSYEDMKIMKPEQAVKHPTWKMGPKISVDSATLMNKGLEIIEACKIFDTNPDNIKIVIHPQSLVHAMISYVDGNTIACISNTDMKIPIASALAWPDTIDFNFTEIDLTKIGTLEFLEPDGNKFPALQLAFDTAKKGGNMPIILNAANEIAVKNFLKHRINLTDIVPVVTKALELSTYTDCKDIDTIIHQHQSAEIITQSIIDQTK